MEVDLLQYEKKYQGYIVAGIDEAGRGPLAGPVVASAVVIDNTNIIPGIKDSKKLSKRKRELLYEQITSNYAWSTAIISHTEIDEINILEATKKACSIAVANLTIKPEIVLVDGNMQFNDKKFVSIVNGDNLSLSIAAASIVAKVTRDRLMLDLSTEFPQYLWHKNSGYGTKEHIKAINTHGLSPYHRKSFRYTRLI
ncbi:MAG: ribonuclease HII [Rickettsia endosymbiont of Ixodes persulcatus]|nr:ribonuclease HII [Rickettsia endosymbiont of Ixodes persulcatus]MCZ6902752.1 ribonuclease HII [Rickettsia endosymbiont of Ixodes persulcatus]MCZ6908316.1 ribonuclease HII [Rickettsia endosymbiont of Ixodes persulcatus]MCZ6914220.1 ribonuclease HII [Rickettsia endosymbiont of Ixodes persulcatus]MCZ6919050.1 ribonuclease HII [Rickettsia endosymbiont of Ixodes persulcatus]